MQHDREEDSSKSTRSNRPPPPRIEEQGISLPPKELVKEMFRMGEAVKWPGKLKTPSEQRDKSKWCEFHDDHGHRTEDCISLRFQVVELLKRGHLSHLLSKSNKKFPEQEHNTSNKGTPAAPPQHAKVINFISGGSSISGASYSAAKRHTRALVHSANITLPEDDCNESKEGPITFLDDEVNDPTHDDALVISITLSNCGVKRVLIDPRSSVNII